MLPIVIVKYLLVKLYGAVCTVITEYSPYGAYVAVIDMSHLSVGLTMKKVLFLSLGEYLGPPLYVTLTTWRPPAKPETFSNTATPFLVSLVLILSGIAYGIGSKSIKSDKEIIENASKKFSGIGSIIILIFVVSQFIAVFRKSNIGMVVTAWLATLLEHLSLSGIPLIVVTLILIAIANLFLTSPTSKWMIFSPVVVPMFMQSNISPQFAQIIMRAGDSMTKGYTPLLASFVIYIGYLNIYNLQKEKPYTIRKSLQLITPYFLIISATWILIIIGWYLIGLPIGPGVNPTL